METVSETVRRFTSAEEFAENWALVAENDYNSYTSLMEDASKMDTVSLSDKLREEWETLAEQVVELTAEHISPIASLFIAQILQGQGSLPFDIIARQAKALHEESNG